MKKMNLLNAEEAGKVNGGAVNPGIPGCKHFDFKVCYFNYIPGCGPRDLIVYRPGDEKPSL